MTNEFLVKKRTIEKLKEESDSVYQYAAAIFWLNGAVFFFSILLFTGGLLFHSTITNLLNGSFHSESLSKIVTLLVSAFTDGQPFNSQRQLNLVHFASNTGNLALTSGMIAYLSYCISQIFLAIKKGDTPFTSRNISYWRKCSHFFSIIAVVLFLASFLTHGALLLSVLTPMLLSCFFYCIALIFEYGSCLQTESDETL